MPIPQTVYVIGSWTRPEFRDAREWLQTHTHAIHFANVDTVVKAIRASNQDPHHVLFVQSRPGQFCDLQIAKLRKTAPLTTVSVLLGSWCEGETRSGEPLNHVPRFWWHDLKTRYLDLRGLKTRHDTTHRPLSLLPATTAEQDRWQFELSSRRPQVAGHIAVYSADRDQSNSICGALNGSGHTTLSLLPGLSVSEASPGTPIDVMVWDDAGGRREARLPPLEVIKACHVAPTVPLLTLRTFPRIQETESDVADGITATIAKPFHVAALLAQIESCLSLATRHDDGANAA